MYGGTHVPLQEDEQVMSKAESQNPAEKSLLDLIIKTLNLEIQADEVDPEDALYDEGLGLDSIDMLEIALAVSQTYGVKLNADDENNQKIFSSLRSLNNFIEQHRSK
jgi:acyl carrier protein